MFHHFHDNKLFFNSPGSITANQFQKIIDFIGRINIIDADLFLLKLQNNALSKKDICITFDDALKCQYKIAIPILEKMKIKAFFFVPTGLINSKKITPEIVRHFIYVYCKGMKFFFNLFEKNCGLNLEKFYSKNINKIKILKRNKFYSVEDIKYRLIRDSLKEDRFNEIISNLFKIKKYNYNSLISKTYMNIRDIKEIHNKNHVIGLHSHSHQMTTLFSKTNNLITDYKKNISEIKKILSVKNNEIKSMSFPFGVYNKKTLQILKKLNIKAGFLSDMSSTKKSNLEMPRNNHVYVMREMNNKNLKVNSKKADL